MARTIRSLFAIETDIDIGDVEAIIGGSLFGALQANVILHLGDLEALELLGATIGRPTLLAGAGMLFVYSVLLALPFLLFVSGSINAFVTRVIMLSRNSTLLQKVLVPLLNVSALGVTLFALGQIYGLLVGVVFFGVLVQLWLIVIGGPSALPALGLVSLFAWMTYGGMMGLVYGVALER